MARTVSTMPELGRRLPAFSATDLVSGRPISPATFADRPALLVMFICRHCPYVKHVQTILADLANEWFRRGVGVVAFSSNDAQAYPEDGPDSLVEMARELRFDFPLCHDESQEIAKSFEAACTPDFFLYDKEQRLAYRGQFDASRPKSELPVTGNDLKAAVEAVLSGGPVATDQQPSLGCNIKWKSGNEPTYSR